MSDDLPMGWVKTELGEIAQVEMGQSPSGDATNTEGIGLPLIGGASDFKEDIIKPTRFTSTPTKICEPNDLILCIRATIGKLAFAQSHYCLGRGVAGLRPYNGIDQSWLKYRLVSDAQKLDAAGTGSTFRQIDKSTLVLWEINLPPLNEQQRIVDKLDRLGDRHRTARNELSHIPKLIARYKQAVLAAAFRGDLTADWREENPDVEPSLKFLDNKETTRSKSDWKDMQKDLADFFIDNFDNLPMNWYLTTANKACTKVVDCHNKTAPYSNQGIKLIRTSNIRNGFIDLSDTKFVDKKTYEYWSRRCLPESGDIIFTREAPMAEVGMIPPDEIICMGQRMMLLRADNVNLVGKYLLFVLQAPFIRQYANHVAVGTGVKHLRVKDVENLPIVVPPPEEQKEIVNRVEKLFKAIDRIEQEHQKASVLLDRLEQTTLAKAFRGELVPQDPNDEPAAILLERIRRERPEQPKTKTGKSRRKPQTESL
jgi:type I restriction enzyme, S subunit